MLIVKTSRGASQVLANQLSGMCSQWTAASKFTKFDFHQEIF